MAWAIGSPSRRKQGFTLLEIMIAIFIVVITLGVAAKLVGDSFTHEALRAAARELAALVKTARTQAVETGRAYEIILDAQELKMRVAPDPLRDLEKNAPGRKEEIEKDYRLPRSIHITVRPWGRETWLEPKHFIWIFSPTGLCAPNRVRFLEGIGDKAAWIEEEFNPLTANRQNEAFYLP